jgi:hypothetical protein
MQKTTEGNNDERGFAITNLTATTARLKSANVGSMEAQQRLRMAATHSYITKSHIKPT